MSGMIVLTVLLSALGFGLDALLCFRAPLTLEGKERRRFLIAAAAVNVWMLAAACLTGIPVKEQPSRFILANGLLLMTTTDLRERMIYDIHFYTLLLLGIAGLLYPPWNGMLGRVIFFLLLFGVLFLISRKKPGLGMGDSRIIACLALYLSTSRWMEVMILALGGAMLYGLFGVFRKKKTLKTEIPFLPFLLAGVLIDSIL